MLIVQKTKFQGKENFKVIWAKVLKLFVHVIQFSLVWPDSLRLFSVAVNVYLYLNFFANV